jgi:hypothetical protein
MKLLGALWAAVMASVAMVAGWQAGHRLPGFFWKAGWMPCDGWLSWVHGGMNYVLEGTSDVVLGLCRGRCCLGLHL